MIDVRGDRSLTLRHVPHNNVPLADTRGEVLKHLRRLWGFGVRLETIGFSISKFSELVDHIPMKVLETAPEAALMG